jgi:hypothetical protein
MFFAEQLSTPLKMAITQNSLIEALIAAVVLGGILYFLLRGRLAKPTVLPDTGASKRQMTWAIIIGIPLLVAGLILWRGPFVLGRVRGGAVAVPVAPVV